MPTEFIEIDRDRRVSAGLPVHVHVRDDAPAIGILNRLHERAAAEGCSDIHFDPIDSGLRVRFRIDGRLREIEQIEAPTAPAVISRAKLLAGMDIAERRLPQDGRYTFSLDGRVLDARVSSIATHHGEKLAIRIVDRRERAMPLAATGMTGDIRWSFERDVQRPAGFVVVCGPTGSGKTTTLYAVLELLDAIERNIFTVEDPVERPIAGVNQVQVNRKAGLTFGSVLRSLLRHDPNVVMIGEIRDGETAELAVSASLSGQLVLASMHAHDAVRAIDRLTDLGVNRAHLATGLTSVLAQRLVPKPDGGRTGVFEYLRVDTDVRAAIAKGVPPFELKRVARPGGYQPRFEDA